MSGLTYVNIKNRQIYICMKKHCVSDLHSFCVGESFLAGNSTLVYILRQKNGFKPKVEVEVGRIFIDFDSYSAAPIFIKKNYVFDPDRYTKEYR